MDHGVCVYTAQQRTWILYIPIVISIRGGSDDAREVGVVDCGHGVERILSITR